jgi:hypothetical protein
MSGNKNLSYFIDDLANLPESISYEEANANSQSELIEFCNLAPGEWCCETSGWPGAFKIPTCPFCGVVAWDSRACAHLVFICDTDSGKYFRLSNRLIEKCNIETSALPHADYWVEEIPEIKVFEATTCMHSSLVWGFLKS